ncbi:hypothetical protein C8J57DRAFT_1314123, partial [Mycena rebaudengoi]
MFSDRRPLAGSNLRSLRAIELPHLQLPGPILQTGLEELVIVRTPLPFYANPPNYVTQLLNLTSLTLDDLPLSLSQTGTGLRRFFRSFSMKRLTRLEVARLDERGSAELMTAIGAPRPFPLSTLLDAQLARIGGNHTGILSYHACARKYCASRRQSRTHPLTSSWKSLHLPYSPVPFYRRRGLSHSWWITI